MEVHGFTEDGKSITATIDGVLMTVPDDMGNRHRIMIAEWEAEDANNIILPYTAPPIDLSEYLANKRWEMETGGMVFMGINVATDDRSKMMIIGARMKAEADINFTTQWKTGPGTFITLDSPTIIAISDAVLTHVDESFALENQVLALITSNAITTTEEIDAYFT